jgi:hypothetical protein
MGRKLPTIKIGLVEDQPSVENAGKKVHLHVMGISAYCKGETTSLFRLCRIWFASLECARRENGFLGVVKCNGTKFLPVTN